MKYLFTLLLTGLFLYSCNNDPVSTNGGTVSVDYQKISTIESGGVKFELYSTTGPALYLGYNDIGFRVFINGNEKKSGFVKFQPEMYHHSTGDSLHSSPVSSSFTFDNTKNLFTGYACFLMASDTSVLWYGDYNYNNEASIDSVLFNVINLRGNQIISWKDIPGGLSYVLTLLNPKSAVLGLNTFSCLLHKTQDEKHYVEVDSAQMFIKPWMKYHGHGSSNNVNPVFLSKGVYEGKANFTMPGTWLLYDSIKINGVFITPSPPPSFIFEIN